MAASKPDVAVKLIWDMAKEPTDGPITTTKQSNVCEFCKKGFFGFSVGEGSNFKEMLEF